MIQWNLYQRETQIPHSSFIDMIKLFRFDRVRRFDIVTRFDRVDRLDRFDSWQRQWTASWRLHFFYKYYICVDPAAVGTFSCAASNADNDRNDNYRYYNTQKNLARGSENCYNIYMKYINKWFNINIIKYISSLIKATYDMLQCYMLVYIIGDQLNTQRLQSFHFDRFWCMFVFHYHKANCIR